MSEIVAPRRKGRPPSQAAAAHSRVLDAVYELLQERSARELTMEMVASRAGVGKPTLYKWWSSKAALILAMFAERLGSANDPAPVMSAEEAIRRRALRLAAAFDGFFGTVMAGLIAEGQTDAAVLRDLYDNHILPRRQEAAAEIDRGVASGELAPNTDAELVLDTIFGPLYFRLMLRAGAINAAYAESLVENAFAPIRRRAPA